MSTLFPLPPQPANTNEDLQTLVKTYPALNATYINLHMRPDWSYAKGFFDGIWSSYWHLADRNFPSELQLNFSQRSWELYLFYLLQKNSLKFVLQPRNRPNPDFKIDLGGRNLFIEAVNAGQGNESNRVETTSDLLSGTPSGQVVGRTQSFDQANHPKVRRITNALGEKMKNYTAVHKTVVGGEDCYIVALNAGDIEGSMISSPEALILEVVKGINPAINYPLQADGSLGPAYHTTRPSILNSQGTNPIDLDLFSKEEYKEISGVIFFGRDVINALLQDAKPSEAIFVHNPNVLPHKLLPMEVFSQFTQITISPTEWTRHAPKT